ncbi:hypothetical protein BJ742DRAFT_836707 [Cladochytrium replicatum]|nr:hypothetical protein BJ742DRAFT_836707 [Cladochytrium replicatum]
MRTTPPTTAANNSATTLVDRSTTKQSITNGIAIVRSQFVNQGTSFSSSVRTRLRLDGVLPSAIEKLEDQASRSIAFMRTLETALQKYMYLNRIKNENTTLFYKLIMDHMSELCPIIYTPTIGEVCIKFSAIITPGFNEGLFLPVSDKHRVTDILGNWPYPSPDICVITDGSRILGLGDLGVNGMGIPIGKLSLYVAAAGFQPHRTLPITLDFGTNTEKYLDPALEPHYIGSRQKRPADPEFFEYMDIVMKALVERWPKLLIQFEDFSSEHAFETLARYRNDYFCFNDDIQGTGAVILAGFINAVRLSGIPLQNHRILFSGAGSAGVGVAQQLCEYFIRDGRMSEVEAKSLFWLLDSKGLITIDRADAVPSDPADAPGSALPAHKRFFVRHDNDGQQFKTLAECVEYVKPTALIGLSAIGKSFDEGILKRMGELNERPLIFPLSNPSANAECTFEEAMTHTEGRVLFASGTAFPPYQIPGTDAFVQPGQGNNMYIFPGLGLGSVLACAKTVTDTMVYQAAVTLAHSLTPHERDELGSLYPGLQRIREISAKIAADVIRVAVREGNATDKVAISMVEGDKEGGEALETFVKAKMWEPKYPMDESLLRAGLRALV